MAGLTSDQIKSNEAKLNQASQYKKQSEEIQVWIEQLTSGSATIDNVSLKGPNNTFLIMDDPNYSVNTTLKSSVIQSLQLKQNQLNQQVQTLLNEVDAAI